MTTRTDAIDDALDRLAAYDYLDGAGFACHGPMGAEAISSLGFDGEVTTWVDAYAAAHAPVEAPPPVDRIDPSDDRSWRSALGDFARVSDWRTLFDRQLREQPWPAVLARWVPRLVSGYGGGLTHGLLRTAHAVRAMPPDGNPSDLLLGELAKGLASWSAWYRPLPGQPHLDGELSLGDAVQRVPRPREPWSAVEAGMLSRVADLEPFADAVEALGPPSRTEEALSDLSATFCSAIVAHTDAMPIGLVHTVTPVAAARTLLDVVPAMSSDAVYARLWQVDAALLAGFAPTPRPLGHLSGARVTDPAELAANAVAHGDAHVVKFTEACLREYAIRPDPIYLLAAADLHVRVPAA
jgi:hypothetical protein